MTRPIPNWRRLPETYAKEKWPLSPRMQEAFLQGTQFNELMKKKEEDFESYWKVPCDEAAIAAWVPEFHADLDKDHKWNSPYPDVQMEPDNRPQLAYISAYLNKTYGVKTEVTREQQNPFTRQPYSPNYLTINYGGYDSVNMLTGTMKVYKVKCSSYNDNKKFDWFWFGEIPYIGKVAVRIRPDMSNWMDY